MCGVAGIFAHSPSAPAADRAELRAIRDHMAARGPDGSGEWFSEDGRVALGHRRLAIIDLSERGAQPMASDDGRYVISYNGEIYNFHALREGLVARGHAFATRSDTEVLLHLFAEKGERMFDDLRGMYAVAIWDSRRGSLLLARDPFGIKPLYYAAGGGTFRFASQVKALLVSAVDASPEPAGHTGFLLWGSVPEPWTLHRGIRALPAGHLLRVDDKGPGMPTPFCRVRDVLGAASRQPAQGDRHEAVAAIIAAIGASVSRHQVADVQVGVFLSAGLDSSLIAAHAATGTDNLFTVTLGFEEFVGSDQDEVPLAEQLARDLGGWHSTLMAGRKDFEDEAGRLFAAMDQPSIDGVNTWFVARAAAHMHLKSALSGLGGDELLASYPSFRQVPALVRLAAPLARFPRLGPWSRRAVSRLPGLPSPKYAGLLEYGTSLGRAYLLRRCLHTPWELPALLGPDMAAQGWEELRSIECLEQTVEGIASPRLAVSALEMEWYMRNQLLRDADWAGMAHSLEIRVPFIDLDLLRQLAPWFAAFPGIGKAELAAAANPQLPKALLRRRKTGFSVPVRQWLGARPGARPERGLRGWARTVHQQFGGAPRP